MVSASDLRPKGRELEPWPVHTPRCINGKQQIDLEAIFILQKPEISAGLMSPLAHPISIGDRLYFTLQQ